MIASEVQPREPGAQSRAFRAATGEPCSLRVGRGGWPSKREGGSCARKARLRQLDFFAIRKSNMNHQGSVRLLVPLILTHRFHARKFLFTVYAK